MQTRPASLVMTIGHSTRTLEEFVALLQAHGAGGVADVRRFPASRRYPHFAEEALRRSLPAVGVAYEHFPDLGGRRRPDAGSPNTGWHHPSFRAYADHMATADFEEALERLLTFAQGRLVAVMCAEAQWWRCHRRLLADALLARGIEVRHIMAAARAPVHEMTPFARRDGVRVHYPAVP